MTKQNEINWDSDDLDLYNLFQVSENDSENKIKQSYRKLALKYHPDKVANEKQKETATRQFHIISAGFCILTDKRKKAIYDETKSIKAALNDLLESVESFDGINFDVLFRKIKVTIPDIQKYYSSYKNSAEEASDVLANYLATKGNMELFLKSYQITTDVAPYSQASQDRFRKIVQEAIDNDKSIKVHKTFFKHNPMLEKKLEKWAMKEAKEAAEIENEMSDLQTLIKKNAAKRELQFSKMIDAKIDQETKKGKRKLKEPSEEEFLKIQKSLRR